ncbi:MAG: XTP/dITP diphosphatase [Spirochaetes bacterium]|nr:XTP/dITP diphosphatase [Spirochaetota bacterium]
MKLVIATNNRGKIREIRDKFSDIRGLTLVTPDSFPNPPVVVEDGNSFLENAMKKGVEIARYTNLPSMADDSGLVVDALGGRPGVHSARYGGESSTDADRNRLLLDEMKGLPPGKRGARFVCVIAIALPDGATYSAEGTCEGVIAERMTGDGGFGYDPVLYLPELGRTMAELTLEEKNLISHRAKALDAAREILLKLIRQE